MSTLAATSSNARAAVVASSLPCSDSSPEALQRNISALMDDGVAMQRECLSAVSGSATPDVHSALASHLNYDMDVPNESPSYLALDSVQAEMQSDGVADPKAQTQKASACNNAYQAVKRLFRIQSARDPQCSSDRMR